MASLESGTPKQPEQPLSIEEARAGLIENGVIENPEGTSVEDDTQESPTEEAGSGAADELLAQSDEESDASVAEAAPTDNEQAGDDSANEASTENVSSEEVAAVENEATAVEQEPADVEWAKYLLENRIEVPAGDSTKSVPAIELIDRAINDDKEQFTSGGGNPDKWSFARAAGEAFVTVGIVNREELSQEGYTPKELGQYVRAAHKMRREASGNEPKGDNAESARADQGGRTVNPTERAPAEKKQKRRESFDTVYGRLESNLGLNGESVEQAESEKEPTADLTEAELEASWRKLVRDYSNEPSNGPERAKIAREAKAAKEKLDEVRSDPDHLKTKLQEARANWQRDVQALGKRMGDTSPEANELRQKVSAEYAEVQALEQQIWDKLVSDNSPESGTTPAAGESDSDSDVEAEGPSRDELSAYTNALEAQYDAIEDKNSDEAAAILKSWREAYAQLVNGAPEQPVAEPETTNPETDAQKAARIAQLEAGIIGEVESSPAGTRFKEALNKYAELKADAETKGWFGRRGLDERLTAAEAELTEAKVKYETEIIEKKRQAGLFEGEPNEVNAQCANELFESLRGIDKTTREAADKVHEKRLEERGRIKRGVAAVGRFFTGGSKVAQILKPGGAGFVSGIGIALSGAAWPITTAATIGLGLGIREAANTANLDKAHVENKGKLAVDDASFAKMKERLEASTESVFKRAIAMTSDILDESSKRSYEIAKNARKKSGKVVMAFSGGVAAGALSVAGAHLIHDAFTAAHADAPTGGGGSTDPTSQNHGAHDADARRQALDELNNHSKPKLEGNNFFVESGHGPIKEIQEAASANGHKISIGRAEDIYNQLYSQYGDKLTSGGPEYHGPTGDLRFGESGHYKWGNGVLDKIVTMSAK